MGGGRRALAVAAGLALTLAPGALAAGAAVVPAFESRRPPDTVETRRPFRVELRQVAGPAVVGGRVRYTARREGREIAGELALEPAGDGLLSAELPPQPADTTFRYHFVLEPTAGRRLLHPAAAPAAYRFRVLPFRVLAVELPRRPVPPGQPLEVAVRLEAPSPVDCAVRWRSAPGPFSEPHPMAATRNGDGVLEARAALPSAAAGAAVDLFFELTPRGGDARRLPADAPRRFFTFKLASPPAQMVGGGAVVAALAGAGERLLVGLYGGGLVILEGGGAGAARRLTLAEGLPSNVVRALAVDPVSGVAYVGTENGLVSLAPGAGRCAQVAGPVFAGEDRELPARPAATLVAISPVDGTVLFQLEASGGGGSEPAAALLMILEDGRLRRLDIAGAGGRILGLSAGRFDAASGCFLLGGVLLVPGTGEVPALVRRCGGTVDVEPLAPFPLDDAEASPSSIEDLARHPATGELVLALRYAAAGSEASGLFALRAGRPVAAADGAADLGAAVTALLPDAARGRLLAATAGAGLVALPPPPAAAEIRGPPGAILSLALAGGALVAGTRDGLVRSAGEGLEPFRRDLLAPGPLAADLLPYDESARGELLTGSARRGFAVLGRGAGGRWEPRRVFAAGRELPGDLLWGEAVFGVDGKSIVGAGLGRGLVWLEGDPGRWLSPAEGLRSRQIWHLWRHPVSDHLWIVYPPLPLRDARGGIQWLDGSQEVRFIPLAERAYATINDLVYMPERGTVFAAGVAGVLEFDGEGRFERRSRHRVAALARDPASGVAVAVGGTVERWDGTRFAPLFFRLEHPRHPAGSFALASALDVAVDRRGRWHILYPEGHLLRLGPDGELPRLFDFEDGVPRSAQRLLYLRSSDQLAVGSTKEGMMLLATGED
ncbi:MAG: hypothetical protein GY856_21195 [bacterium]|nr:hypothetical protein [bacterium]